MLDTTTARSNCCCEFTPPEPDIHREFNGHASSACASALSQWPGPPDMSPTKGFLHPSTEVWGPGAESSTKGVRGAPHVHVRGRVQYSIAYQVARVERAKSEHTPQESRRSTTLPSLQCSSGATSRASGRPICTHLDSLHEKHRYRTRNLFTALPSPRPLPPLFPPHRLRRPTPEPRIQGTHAAVRG